MGDEAKSEPTPAPTVDELAVQLRAYANALESTRPNLGVSDPTPVAGIADVGQAPTRRRLYRLVPVAVAAAAVIGVTGWWVISQDGASLSTADSTVPTIEAPDPAPYLLPDLSAWAMTDYGEDVLDSHVHTGIWVWRLDGHLILLSENVPGSETPQSRDQAQLRVDNERSMLRWAEDGVGYDLQGLGVDEATLRTALDSMVRDGAEWMLPGADLVTSELAGPRQTGVHEQVTFVPRDDDGVPVLSERVQASVTPGSVADVYRTLHEAGGLGPVSEIDIGGQPGVLVSSPDFSVAVVAVGGRVVYWQTATPDVDLVDLLASVSEVTPDDWDEAVAGIGATIAEAVADADIEPIEDASSAELPRYTLPEPWTLEWVTDTGIWTPEQRAQRQALAEASAGPGADFTVRPVRSQGYGASVPSGAIPIAVPDLAIMIWEHDGGGDSDADTGFGQEGEPFSLGDLDGFIYPAGYIMGRGAGIELKGESLYVEIRTNHMSEIELRSFVETLTPRDGDPRNGFDADGAGRELLVELEGPEADIHGSGTSSWLAAWRGGDDPDLQASISVMRVSAGWRQMSLMMDGTNATLSSIEGGRYLVATPNPDPSPGVTITPQGDPRVTISRHDADSHILTSLSVTGTVDEAVELMEQLIEVDLDDWKTLVAPVNADPLKPR